MEDRRNSLIFKLRQHVRVAKYVIALDADLGWTTFRFLNSCIRSPKLSGQAHVYLNDFVAPKKPIRLYESKNHLVADIHQAVSRGERCFITSNSKAMVNRLFETLSPLVADGKIVQITSDNSQAPTVQSLLFNIRQRARDYQVILTSPSVSTGIDISFESQEEVFDHVFGIFEPLISTHFECDQQLSRVRDPKSISVYVTPSVYGFETNLDVVKADLLVGRLLEMLIDGYTAEGTMAFRTDHPILDLACSVVSAERASKNNLKRNFRDHKERQGHSIEVVTADPSLGGFGKDKLNEGQQKVDERYLSAITGARQLSRNEMAILEEQIDSGTAVPEADRDAFTRTLVELFYREQISRDLLLTDNRGRFMAVVRMFEDMTNPDLVALESRIVRDKEYPDPLIRLSQSRHFRLILLQRALQSTGLWSSRGFDWSRELDTRDLGHFIEFVQRSYAEFETQFGIEIRVDLTTKPVSQLNSLLRFVGLGLTKLKGRIASGDKRINRYAWDMEKVGMMKRLANRRSSYPDPWQSPPFGQS